MWLEFAPRQQRLHELTEHDGKYTSSRIHKQVHPELKQLGRVFPAGGPHSLVAELWPCLLPCKALLAASRADWKLTSEDDLVSVHHNSCWATFGRNDVVEDFCHRQWF